jgi:hypothetical protein
MQDTNSWRSRKPDILSSGFMTAWWQAISAFPADAATRPSSYLAFVPDSGNLLAIPDLLEAVAPEVPQGRGAVVYLLAPVRVEGDYSNTPLGKKPHEIPRPLETEKIPAMVEDYRRAAQRA